VHHPVRRFLVPLFKAGERIKIEKLTAFFHYSPRAVCIVAAFVTKSARN
jgi:hypothetical protein